MNINSTAKGVCVCSSSNCRRVPGENPILKSNRFGRWIHGYQPQRVKGSDCAQSPLYTQWPRINLFVPVDWGRQYKNTKPRRNLDIQSQARGVNGIAALVTTPLRSLVTRAPSGQANQAPGFHLSQGLLLFSDAVPFAHLRLTTGVHRRRWTRPRPWHAS